MSSIWWSLWGIAGKNWQSQEKLSVFERAFYQTVQKSDETNDSYLARHDASFEDMMAKSVSMEEVRAYVMIRQSQLSSEDRKRIVVETEGNLTYAGAALSTAVFSPYSHARFSGQTYHSRCHIGMHVDDGIEVGTITIWKSLGDSGRSILLGAFNIMEFDFCGIRYRQMEDGSTEMFQRRYVEQIDTNRTHLNFETSTQGTSSSCHRARAAVFETDLRFPAVCSSPGPARYLCQSWTSPIGNSKGMR